MLTIDCREIEPIKHELSVYVSDQIGAIPAIKSHEFVLSPIDDDDLIDISGAVSSIREYLESIGENRNFAVIVQKNAIAVKSVSGEPMRRDSAGVGDEMFSCPHCGFVTRYEVEYNVHKKIHYL